MKKAVYVNVIVALVFTLSLMGGIFDCAAEEKGASSTLTPSGGPMPKTGVKMPEFFTMQGGASPGSTSDILTRGYEELLVKYFPKMKTRRLPMGTRDALISLQGGTINYGPVMTEMLVHLGLKGKLKGYEGKGLDNIRHMGYSSAGNLLMVFVVLRGSPIKDISDLYNKRVHTGIHGSSSEIINRKILKFYGLSYESIKKNGGLILTGDLAEAASMLSAGTIDAFGSGTVHPYAPLVPTAATKGIRILSLSEEAIAYIEKERPGMVGQKLPSGVYPGQKEVLGLAYGCLVLAHKNLPEDVVYNLCAAHWSEKNPLGRKHAGWKGLDLLKIATSRPPVIPVHPGAAKYWADRGIQVVYQK